MIKFLEVLGPEDMSGLVPEREKLAALDVTPDNEVETLAEARILYGVDCLYRWHFCAHDQSGSCQVIVI